MKTKDPNILLHNGKMVTVDKEFSIAEALLISGNRILAVGDVTELRSFAAANTEEIDLKGKMVLPGIIDSHPHAILHGIRREITVRISGLGSIRRIKEKIAEAARRLSPGEWIVTQPVGDAPDYFHLPEALEEGRWPTRYDLDEAAPMNPVYIEASLVWAPHPAILNSHALRLLGIDKNTPSEEKGAIIVKDPKTGEPNGQLHRMHPWNYGSIYPKIMQTLPKPTRDQMLKGVKSAIDEFNASGVTAGYEGHMTSQEHFSLCRELWERKELTMRMLFAYQIDIRKPLKEIDEWMGMLAHATGNGFGDSYLKVCGVTASNDGPSQLGISLMNKPYLDPYGDTTTGFQRVPSEKLEEIALLAARHHLRMNVSIGGDRAAEMALDAYENVNKKIPIDTRKWVLQHIQHPSQATIDRCRKLGVVVTTCSNFEYSKGQETYVNRLGGDYCDRAIPFRSWLDSGVTVAQSTDGAHLDPMFTIWNSLKRIDGRTGDCLMTPHKKISREEAVRLYTIHSAKVLLWEDQIGSLEAGKLADLIILDNDILGCPIDEIKETRNVMTMVGGKIVYGTL